MRCSTTALIGSDRSGGWHVAPEVERWSPRAHTLRVPAVTQGAREGSHGPVRAAAGVAYRRAVAVLQRLDPSQLALRRTPWAGTVTLACVYRGGAAPVVRELLAQLPAGADVRLWSLDGQVPPDLQAVTRGAGPGNRAVLLNGLVAGCDADLVVLVDDDVRVVVGDLGALFEAGRQCGLDLFQPAHLASSHASWEFVRRRPLTYVRETDFVEQGPLLVLTRTGQAIALPLPEQEGMTWGVELRWWTRARELGARIGIVDAVAVRHLHPAAHSYDRGAEQERLDHELRLHGLTSLQQIQVVHRRVGVREARSLLRPCARR